MSLLKEKGKQHLMSSEAEGNPMWPGGAGACSDKGTGWPSASLWSFAMDISVLGEKPFCETS